MKPVNNPFNTSNIHKIRYIFYPEGGMDSLMRKLAELDYKAAVAGPESSGKTTLLEDISINLTGKGFKTKYIKIDKENSKFPKSFFRQFLRELHKSDIVLFDGCEQLGYFFRICFKKEICARAGGLIVTVHRPGRFPTLWECGTSEELFRRIVDLLLAGSKQNIIPHADFAGKLYDKHRGNIRLGLRELYDFYSSIPDDTYLL